MNLIKTESFNTNNPWGFGGKVGRTEYYSNGLVVTVARNYHRHTGTSSANEIGLSYKGDVIPIIYSPSVEEILDSGILFIYQNETGFNIASLKDKGDAFERNYHNYKLIDKVKIS